MDTNSMIHPNYLPAARQFQRIFSHYFPNLADDINEAAVEMDWIETYVLRNPLDTVRRAKAKRDLKKLVSCLRFLSDYDVVFWRYLAFISLQATDSDDPVLQYQDKISRFLMLCTEMKDEGLVDAVMEKFARDAECGIEYLPEAGNINWEAVHALSGLRTLWRRNTGRRAPTRALNPASQFAAYLQDGFDFLEISANPISAFKRWVAKLRDDDLRYERD